MSIPGAAGLREATWVQSGWRALSACWVHCRVCITGGQQHSSIQLNSLHTHVTPLLQQWAVAWVEQMCHWNQECLPWARTAQSPGHTCQGWGMATCSNTRLQAIPDAQCTQHTKICSAPQGPLALYIFRCVAPSWIHLPSPLTWKRRGRRGMSHAFCTMPPWQQPVTAC